MEEVENNSWNYKRIFIALFLLAGIIAGGYYVNAYVFGNKISLPHKEQKISPIPSESIKGVTSEEETNIQEALKEKIEDIKKNVESLNVVDIATSSPQVQKILNDIKALEQYPKSQFQDVCKKICDL